MNITTSSNGEPRRWRLDEALRENEGLTTAQIEELKTDTDQLDLVELATALEEKFGIEIDDQDLLGPLDPGFTSEPRS